MHCAIYKFTNPNKVGTFTITAQPFAEKSFGKGALVLGKGQVTFQNIQIG